MSPSLLVVAIRSACVMARLLAVLVVARQLSPENFAAMAIAVAATDVAKVFADAGVDVFSLREYGRDPHRLRQNAYRVLLTKLVLSTVAAVILAGVLLWLVPGLPLLFLVPIVVLPGLQLGLNFFLNIALAQGHAGWLIRPALVVYGLYFSSLALVFVQGRYAEWVFAGLLVLEAVLLVALSPQVRSLLASADRSFKHLPARNHISLTLRGAFPVGLAAAIAILYGRADIFAIKTQFSSHEVGLYAFASRLLDPGLQLINGWIATKGGRYAGLWANQAREYVRGGLHLLSLSIGIAALAAVLAIALSRPGLKLLFPAFEASHAVLIILSLALIPRVYNNTLTTLLIAAHQERFMPRISLANLGILAASLWVLLPTQGLAGAAYALLITEVINSIVQTLLLRRTVMKRLEPANV